MIPVAFYAPLKSPNHPSPSGDRTMGRLMMKALGEAGFSPNVSSELRTFEPLGDPGRQGDIQDASRREAHRLTEAFLDRAPVDRPRLWFTYHNYYKAPDHLGPEMARRLRIPYALAEASRAGKRARGPWVLGHAAAEAANDAADVVFVVTAHDREAWERSHGARQRLVDLPPFVDLSCWPSTKPARHSANGPTRLLAVAMMRSGDKLSSYRLLADALNRVERENWTLDIVGDGPAASEVAGAFQKFAGRVRFQGACDSERIADFYRAADLLAWPAVNEAYGMVLLEAQAVGCPVLAGGYGGVASAMIPGETGIMSPAGDMDAFAHELRSLLDDPGRRQALGKAAQTFVREQRGLASASAILRDGLAGLVCRDPSA